MVQGRFFFHSFMHFFKKLHFKHIEYSLAQLYSYQALLFSLLNPQFASEKITMHIVLSGKQKPSASLTSRVANLKDWPLNESFSLSRCSNITNRVHTAKPFSERCASIDLIVPQGRMKQLYVQTYKPVQAISFHTVQGNQFYYWDHHNQ